MDKDVIVVDEEMVEEHTAVSPGRTSRRLVMAGLGMAVMIGSEMKSAVHWLMEQGETGAKGGRPGGGRHTRPWPPRSPTGRLQKPVDALRTRLNIPAKADVDALNQQVTTLLEKIDRLQQQEQRSRPKKEAPLSTAESDKL